MEQLLKASWFGSLGEHPVDLQPTFRRKLCGASLSTPKCVSVSKSRCTSPTA